MRIFYSCEYQGQLVNETELLDKKRSSKKVESKGLRPHKRATTNDTATTVETIDGERDKGHDALFIQTPLSDTVLRIAGLEPNCYYL